MIKSVKFMAKSKAEILDPINSIAMISISEPGDTVNLKPGWKNLLELKFDDVDNSKYSDLIPFNSNQALSVIEFMETLPKYTETILVHCYAGISRSAAVAKFLAEVYELEFNHKYDLYNKLVYNTLRNTYFNELYHEYEEASIKEWNDFNEIQ